MSEYLRKRKKQRAAARRERPGLRSLPMPVLEHVRDWSEDGHTGGVDVTSDSHKVPLWDNVGQSWSAPFEGYQRDAYLMQTVFLCTAPGCGWHTFHSSEMDKIKESKDGGGSTDNAHLRSVAKLAKEHATAEMIFVPTESGVGKWNCSGCGNPFGPKSHGNHIKDRVEAGKTHEGASFRHIRQYSLAPPAQPERAAQREPAMAGAGEDSWLTW